MRVVVTGGAGPAEVTRPELLDLAEPPGDVAAAPRVVVRDTMPRPQSSHGVEKHAGEQLVADSTRKGFVRGRSVRLMTMMARPGRPDAAASSFLSSMVREPVAVINGVDHCP